ncbi:MAG: hypothetical protein ACR2NP_01530 [Pirellulaceae bacterium]
MIDRYRLTFYLNGGGVNIAGTLYIDLGEGGDLFNAQNVSLAGSVFGGDVFVVGSEALGGNSFLTDAATVINGDVFVVFSSSTNINTAVFRGTYSGTYGTYRGGTTVDVVNFGADAEDMTFVALMGDSDDELFWNRRPIYCRCWLILRTAMTRW